MKLLYPVILSLILVGCGSDSEPLPPPTSGADGYATQSKYALWSNEQLELKRAQLRHELDRSFIEAGAPIYVDIAQGQRNRKQRQVEEIESELLRRDPSGGLLAKSNALLADPH